MKWVKPSEINGILSAPSSKSMMIRATAAALLCKEGSQIFNPSFCDDAMAGLGIIEALGAQVEKEDQVITIKTGQGSQETVLDCNESGLCMRMFTPIAALGEKKLKVTGTGSLKTRPMGMMETPLEQLGVTCKTDNGFPPIQIRGPIRGGKIKIDGSLSSQFITGLLFALPLCQNDSDLVINNLKSKPYVAMTLDLLEEFGISICSEKDYTRFFINGGQAYKKNSYEVEGDWSGAAFLLTAGAIGGKIEVDKLSHNSLQADKKIIEVLESAGASVSIRKNMVFIESNRLDSFDFDASECPDLFPPLTALACCCSGRSRIAGIERLRHKESDRASVLLSEFRKIGAKIHINGNRMEIEGKRLQGGIIDSHNDHRIAMAGAVAAISSELGVRIRNWQAVSKSYPRFFDDLKSIGGKVS